jgi:hypothetical protein
VSTPVAAPAPAVFVARGVTKTYHMGEVDAPDRVEYAPDRQVA